MTVVGIDPDVERNGVATLDTATGKLALQTLDFAHTLDYIRNLHDLHLQAAAKAATTDGHGCGLVVVVEAGWMNHGNYHTRQWHGRQASASIGRDQGRNEQTSRLIGEMLRHWGVPYVFKKPLTKMWGGHDRKITAAELEALTRQRLGRTNQESRDAALLAWTHAAMPMHLDMATLKAIVTGGGATAKGK